MKSNYLVIKEKLYSIKEFNNVLSVTTVIYNQLYIKFTTCKIKRLIELANGCKCEIRFKLMFCTITCLCFVKRDSTLEEQ